MKKTGLLFSIAILIAVAALTTTVKVEAGYTTFPSYVGGYGCGCAYPPNPYNNYYYYTSLPNSWYQNYNNHGSWYDYNNHSVWNGYGFPYGQSYYNGLPYQAYYRYSNYGPGYGLGRCYYTVTGAYVCS